MILLFLVKAVVIILVINAAGDRGNDDGKKDDIPYIEMKPTPPQFKPKKKRRLSSFYSDRQMMRRCARFWRSRKWK